MSLVCKCVQCFIHVHTIAITIIACFSLLLDRSLKMDHSEALLYPQPLASSNMALDCFRFKLIWIQMCTESRFREILKCHRFQACFSNHQSLTDTASFNRQHLTLRSHPAVHDAKGQKEMEAEPIISICRSAGEFSIIKRMAACRRAERDGPCCVPGTQCTSKGTG